MAATKSKGPGTVLLVLIVLLAIAGGSAWFIHSILSGEEAAAPGVTAEGGQPGEGSPGQNTPSGMVFPGGQTAPGQEIPGQAVSGEAVPGQVPPGQVSPGQTVPGQLAENAPQPDAASGGLLEPDTSEPGQGSTRNMLLVPGAIEQPAPAAREDAVVRPAFVNDIAAFLAQNYWPRNSHPSARRAGITTVSLRWANLRYGAELQGLEGRGSDPAVARKAVLGYVLNPAAIGRIYDLYAEGFVSALAREAERRAVGEGAAKRFLTMPERKEMFTIYAGYAGRVASALEKYAADSGMAARVEAYAKAAQAVEDANRAYMESMIAYEEAAERGPKAAASAARLKMDKDAATYQKRIRERETKRETLVAAMSRDNKATISGGDTLVYVAFWAYRRGTDSAPALRACAKALGDMSGKLTAAAKTFN
ncbi:hypothetical protein LJC26_06015 [Desulfovibrio sp. OttesenSCG-928-O18]|nr:hypothetical protein [Desulfovibrio sp. OttesenSCG-928-O18]